MKLTSEQWKNGIANSHYTGVANLRNVRIDDEGVLRVMNRPQKVSDITGTILDIKKGYYDISNDYYAIFDQVGDTLDGRISDLVIGDGGIYQSRNNDFVIDSFSNGAYSGGMVWRDYFFPLPATTNIDAGYWTDTNSDGKFNSLSGDFEVLVSKGQTQSQFISQFSPIAGGSTIAMITDSKYIVEISNVAYIKDKDGSIDATLTPSGTIQDVVKVSDTACGVVTGDSVYIYDLSGNLLATYTYDFSRGNVLSNISVSNLDNNKFVTLSKSRSFDEVTIDWATGSQYGENGIESNNYPGASEWDKDYFSNTLISYDNDIFSDNGSVTKLTAEYIEIEDYYTNNVVGEYNNVSDLPASGGAGVYVVTGSDEAYFWNGASYELDLNVIVVSTTPSDPLLGKTYINKVLNKGFYLYAAYISLGTYPSAIDKGDVAQTPSDYLEFVEFEFNGTNSITFIQDEVVFAGGDGDILIGKEYIGCFNNKVAVLYNSGPNGKIRVFEKNGLNWDLVDESIQAIGTNYAPIEGYNDKLFLFGDITSLYNWDDSKNELVLADDTIIAPNGITSVGGSGDYFGIKHGNNYSVYKYEQSLVDHTPSLIMRDIMYWANGNSIASLQETGAEGTFDPTDDTTYNLQLDALDLPLSTKITALADIGTYMAIGTESGKIYFWDLNSGSFDIPVNIGEPIGAMNSKNNLLYITSQKAGNVYIANLSSYSKTRNLSSLTKYRFDTVTKGMEFFDDGAYMGAKINNDDTYTGIWVFRNGAWNLIGTDEQVTAIAKSSPNVLVYATLDGIYELDIAGSPVANWSDDGAYIVTPMEIVGTVSSKAHGSSYQMYFDNAFSANEYVKLYYRTTTSGDWQHIQTVTSEQLVADSGLFAFKGALSIPKTEQVQYKIVLNTTAGMVMFNTN